MDELNNLFNTHYGEVNKKDKVHKKVVYQTSEEQRRMVLALHADMHELQVGINKVGETIGYLFAGK